ncbi:hypothetical protein ACFPN7_39800 [Amycolatopsis halotolerans]
MAASMAASSRTTWRGSFDADDAVELSHWNCGERPRDTIAKTPCTTT